MLEPTTLNRLVHASMKVPPKRKGKCCHYCCNQSRGTYLNESPSQEEGKFATESPAGRFPDEPQ